MRKAILVILLSVVSSSAAADWVKVSSTEDATFYANPATIRKVGNKVKMWGLIDLDTAQPNSNGKMYLSLMEQSEYDCKEEQVRSLAFTAYSEKMGGGKVVSVISRNDANWNPVPPGSNGVTIWKIACGKMTESEIQGVTTLDRVGVEAYIQKNYSLAFSRFLRDAQKGDLWSMNYVGEMLQEGMGTPQNYSQANKWLHLAAGKGNAGAMERLGHAYERGLGVQINIEESIKWYQGAAVKGNAVAMQALGKIYAHGDDGVRNPAAAAKWYKACAHKGHAGCMFAFATFLERGDGVEMDLVSAYAWYDVAATMNSELFSNSAKYKRDNLAQTLPSAQLSRAQNMSLKLLDPTESGQ
ncbi:MAG: sel1 repeat family protein [Gallionella sp.]|nr:sel1 repeat family protein [Gallionella sp.]